jgi:hypothetical protein
MPKPPKNPNDGRRTNRPPVETQIVDGEIRNPHGAGGKPKPTPKRKSDPPSSIEKIYLAEAERIVSRDANGDVTAAQRLVQDEYHDALVLRDAKARARLIKQVAVARAKEDQQWAEFEEWFRTCKAEYKDEFDLAERTKRPPPDVGHPDHVHLVDRQLIFTGPLERREREAWEELKFGIKLAQQLHRRARTAVRDNPTEDNRLHLKGIEVSRRRLMRCVPKGWKWREEIYCRDSQRKVRREILAEMKD